MQHSPVKHFHLESGVKMVTTPLEALVSLEVLLPVRLLPPQPRSANEPALLERVQWRVQFPEEVL